MDKQRLLSDSTKSNAFDLLRRELKNAILSEQAGVAEDYTNILKQFIENQIDVATNIPSTARDVRDITIQMTLKRIAEREKKIAATQARLDALLRLQERPGAIIDAVTEYRAS